MRHLLAILAALALLAAPAQAQTLKSLMYNTTNGSVVAPAIAFTNPVSVLGVTIGPNGLIQYQGEDVYDMSANTFVSIVDFDHPDATRANLGFSTNLNTLWTATNASNARSAVGLGATNMPFFNGVVVGDAANNPTTAFIANSQSDEVHYAPYGITFYSQTNASHNIDMANAAFNNANTWTFNSAIGFGAATNAASNIATTRTNLSLGLQALTNTSNVTMMRALSGSTNTNHPYSGSISVTGTNNTNTLVFSNGILQSVQ